MYDSLLELYNIHKVEQTNDVYCVIGGLPVKTPTHATDVANYAIQLMWNVKRLTINELPDVKIQIRCGVHTGLSFYILLRILNFPIILLLCIKPVIGLDPKHLWFILCYTFFFSFRFFCKKMEDISPLCGALIPCFGQP